MGDPVRAATTRGPSSAADAVQRAAQSHPGAPSAPRWPNPGDPTASMSGSHSPRIRRTVSLVVVLFVVPVLRDVPRFRRARVRRRQSWGTDYSLRAKRT